uniref:RING-type domain-containing protein n=1 Tax=viral metagenome TaxID=1070528 RepID=A0A6C0BYC2_9ZZZZ
MKTKIDCHDKTCFYKFKLFFCGRVALCCGWRACKKNRANKLVETDNIIHIPPVCRAPSCCSPHASRDLSIDDVDSVEGIKGKCAICKKKSDDIVILPCGHGDHCTACLENWYDTNDACPICGDKTIDVVQCL